MTNGINDITRVERAVQKVYSRTPAMVGGLAVDFFKDRFRRGGWHDRSFEPWTARKREERGARRAIGVKSGRLRRSIREYNRTRRGVFIGTDVPYAQRFNEGYTGTVLQKVRSHKVRKHQRRGQTVREHTRSEHSRTQQVYQEARPFIGESDFLNRRIEMNIEHELRKELSFLTNI